MRTRTDYLNNNTLGFQFCTCRPYEGQLIHSPNGVAGGLELFWVASESILWRSNSEAPPFPLFRCSFQFESVVHVNRGKNKTATISWPTLVTRPLGNSLKVFFFLNSRAFPTFLFIVAFSFCCRLMSISFVHQSSPKDECYLESVPGLLSNEDSSDLTFSLLISLWGFHCIFERQKSVFPFYEN